LPDWADPEDYAVDYKVPNLGADSEIVANQKNLAEAEASLGHTMKATFKKPKPEKRDYFVPDLGEDEDTRDTKENLGNAEEELGHTLDAENLLPP